MKNTKKLKRTKVLKYNIAVLFILACFMAGCGRVQPAAGESVNNGITPAAVTEKENQSTESVTENESYVGQVTEDRKQVKDVEEREGGLQTECEPQSEYEAQTEPRTEKESGEEESKKEEFREQESREEITAAPEKPRDMHHDAVVEEKLSAMTLYEKVCQMLFVTPESIAGISPVTFAGEEMKKALETYPVGGIIWSAGNLRDKNQVRQMLKEAQNSAETGLFLSADEEGGTVNRLMKTIGTTYIGSMYDYRNDGPGKAYENAFIIGSDMAAVGFNLDFAPVADVWSNEKNTVIGKRAYSDDYAEAAQLIEAAVRGFHDGGVLCTLKHFPGHGDTMEDSHYGSAYVNRSKQEMETAEWLPFQSGIREGADFVMVGHLIVPALDTKPATLSSVVIQDILRNELGFERIVITDSLAMGALADHYSTGEMAVLAVEAGNDMLLMPSDVLETIEAIINAVGEGRISEGRIDESVKRILSVKLEKRIWKP